VQMGFVFCFCQSRHAPNEDRVPSRRRITYQMSTHSYITRGGYEKLEKELQHLKSVERPAVIKSLTHARSYGDLSENAEYSAAKERQLQVESKINSISQRLASSIIVDESMIPADKAYLGATVRLKDKKTGEEITYRLVSTVEADFNENKISTESPVGRALLGKMAGESVEITVPAGKFAYEILSVSRE